MIDISTLKDNLLLSAEFKIKDCIELCNSRLWYQGRKKLLESKFKFKKKEIKEDLLSINSRFRGAEFKDREFLKLCNEFDGASLNLEEYLSQDHTNEEFPLGLPEDWIKMQEILRNNVWIAKVISTNKEMVLEKITDFLEKSNFDKKEIIDFLNFCIKKEFIKVYDFPNNSFGDFNFIWC